MRDSEHVAHGHDGKEYLATLGLLVVEWNALESNFRYLVDMLAGGGPKIAILTNRISLENLNKTLLVLQHEHADPALKCHLKHLADCFDKLRVSRNWILHNILAVVLDDLPDGSQALAGFSFARDTNKERLRHRHLKVLHVDLENFIDHSRNLSRYVDDLLPHVLEMPADIRRPLDTVDRPPLPDLLTLQEIN